MPFESLLGNAAAFARLRGVLASRRIAHAWLFAGPEGVGKRTAALEFAAALGARPLLIEKPEDRHEILIAQVHEVILRLGMTSEEPRAVIFNDAHRMSEEAMNALLKTLEEPGQRTLILLVTHRPERLLGTIRSRCQGLYFAPLEEADLAAWVRQELKLSEADARVAALIAEGSPGTARTLAPDLAAIQERARDLQARVLSGELNPVVEALTRIRDTEEQRLEAKRGLRLLAHAVREALRARSGGYVPCLATKEFIDRLSTLDADELAERLETLLDHERIIDLNANVPLTVEDACLRL